MVQHIGIRIQNDLQRRIEPLKIWDQNLNPALRTQFPDQPGSSRKNLCAPMIVIIAVHAGNHGMFDPKRGNGVRYTPRLVPVNRLRTPFRHRAKSAASRANIAQ